MEYLQSIAKLFQDQLYSVPDYQRGYAWERRHWQDLWDDIELLEDGQEHYTGTLVLHSIPGASFSDDNGDVFTQHDIVDGQQRLTTISILMVEMIRQFELLGNKKSKALRNRYIVTTKDGVQMPKLKLNRDTNDFYRRSIIAVEGDISATPKIFSERRLQEARDFFRKQFEEKKVELGSGFGTWLEGVNNKVVSQMKLTVYVVPEESDVGVIFEVMNNRGKPLAEMEKVKNYLLFVCAKLTACGGSALADEINKAWKYIYETLMANNVCDLEDNLLRFNWIVTQNYKPSEWKGCNSIKEAFDLKKHRGNYEALRDSIRSYVSLLPPSCKAFCDIIAPDRDLSFDSFNGRKEKKEIVEYSQKLVRLKTTAAFVPLLMALRLKNPAPDAYLNILKICEKYAFRVFALMERRTNAGQSAMYISAYRYFHGECDLSDLRETIEKQLTYFCDRKTYESKVDTIGDWYNRKGIKYILFEYETYLANGANVKINWKEFQEKDKKDTIEHILPQTPTEPYWRKRWKEKDIEEVTHDIGNLVVTLDNSSYSNYGFEKKKGLVGAGAGYANSNLFSERELCVFVDWTREAFEDRRKKIADWMKDRWFAEDYLSANDESAADVSDDFDSEL